MRIPLVRGVRCDCRMCRTRYRPDGLQGSPVSSSFNRTRVCRVFPPSPSVWATSRSRSGSPRRNAAEFSVETWPVWQRRNCHGPPLPGLLHSDLVVSVPRLHETRAGRAIRGREFNSASARRGRDGQHGAPPRESVDGETKAKGSEVLVTAAPRGKVTEHLRFLAA